MATPPCFALQRALAASEMILRAAALILRFLVFGVVFAGGSEVIIGLSMPSSIYPTMRIS